MNDAERDAPLKNSHHPFDEPGTVLALAAAIIVGIVFGHASCTARDRHAIRTIADIADETCKDIQAPRDCLNAIATNPKFAKAEAESPPPNNASVQVFCGSAAAPAASAAPTLSVSAGAPAASK